MRKRRYAIANKRKLVSRVALLLLAVLVVAGAVLGAIKLFSAKGGKSTALPFGPEDAYCFTGAGFLYLSGESLNYMDLLDSRKNSSTAVNTADLSIAASSTLSVIYNNAAVQIVGAAESITLPNPPEQIACGTSHVAVMTEGSKAKTILVFDATGKQVDQMDFETTTLLDFGFAGVATETLWTLELDDTASLPVSTLKTYNLAAMRTTGVMTVQGALIQKSIFTEKSIFVSCTDCLTRYNAVGNTEAYRLSVYGWQLADQSVSGAPLLLYVKNGVTSAAEAGSVRLYQLQEAEVASAAVSTVQLPAGTVGCFLAGGKLYAFTPEAVYSYSAAGKQLSVTELQAPITAAAKLSDAYALITADGALSLYSLS